MDESKIVMDDILAEGGILVNSKTQKHIRTAGVWALLLAILGILGIIIFAFSGISLFAMGDTDLLGPNAEPMKIFGGFMVLAALLYGIPVYYLLKFAIKAMKIKNSSDSNDLEELLVSFKNYLMFIGIMIVLSTILFFGFSMYMGTVAQGLG